MRVGMCIGMRVGMCVGMRVGMRIETCIDTCIDSGCVFSSAYLPGCSSSRLSLMTKAFSTRSTSHCEKKTAWGGCNNKKGLREDARTKKKASGRERLLVRSLVHSISRRYSDSKIDGILGDLSVRTGPDPKRVFS